MTALNHWYFTGPEDIGNSVTEFLQLMGESTVVHLRGRNRGRRRIVTTLVHGNEISGAKGLFRLLREGTVPAVDTCCFFASVETALAEPLYSHRQRPGGRDFNRCFRPPFTDREGATAHAFMAFLESTPFEALIDVHNTSGMGPPFAIARRVDPAHEALASFFTERLMVTGLKLDSLFEFADRFAPSVTVECGGATDPHADEIAYEGIRRYMLAENVLSPDSPDLPLQLLNEPARLELAAEGAISFGFEPDPSADITLLADIEHFNLAEIGVETHLGWVAPESWNRLRLLSPEGEDLKEQMLRLEGGRLLPAIPVTLLMITTNPVIAKSDCLFYVAPAGDSAARRAYLQS